MYFEPAFAWTATLSALNTFAGGLWAVCAGVIISAGTSAPACIAAGTFSALSVILSICADSGVGSTKDGSHDPEGKRALVDMPRIEHVLLHSGDHTTPTSPFTTETLNQLILGDIYNVTHSVGEGLHTLSRTTQGVEVGTRFFDENASDTPAARSNTYNHVNMNAYWDGTDHHTYPSYQNGRSMAQTIANRVVEPGSWCLSINGIYEKNYIEIGLSASTIAHSIPKIHPCEARIPRRV